MSTILSCFPVQEAATNVQPLSFFYVCEVVSDRSSDFEKIRFLYINSPLMLRITPVCLCSQAGKDPEFSRQAQRRNPDSYRDDYHCVKQIQHCYSIPFRSFD